MYTVTVDEFCADVDDMLARIESGDFIEVTRDGEVIATSLAKSDTRVSHKV